MKDEFDPINYPRYDFNYQERLKTFRGIQLPVSPEEFALAGFSYTGPGDRVICLYCHGKLEDWSKGDDPLAEHIRHYESCPFLAPLTKKPKWPKYSRHQDRLKSFKRWGLKYPSVDDLASSGFVFRKDPIRNDLVQCFHCGVALHSWATTDVPWTEHAKWSPHCAHVIRVRGYEFVQQVKANKFCSDIPQIDLSKMLRANDIEKIPVINDLNAKQMENFCHNLLSDIACKICYSNRANVVLLECLHLAMCSVCCEGDLSACPVCRTEIKNNAVRVFLP